MRIGAGRYRLRLSGVSPHLTTFTDRPRRRAGQVSSAGFVRRWGAYGFRADPPNAALVVDGAPSNADVVLLTLSHPRYDPATRTMTYTALALRKAPAGGELTGFDRRADPIRARSFGSASLFIDDASVLGWTYPTVTFNAQNVTATASMLSFVLGAGSTFATTGSSQVQMLGIGSLSPDAIYLTSSALGFQLQPGASGSFSLNLPIAVGFSGSAPTVTVNNFVGSMTVSWPTAIGPQFSTIAPGEPLTLTGLV